jgi:hypothetical protein
MARECGRWGNGGCAEEKDEEEKEGQENEIMCEVEM